MHNCSWTARICLLQWQYKYILFFNDADIFGRSRASLLLILCLLVLPVEIFVVSMSVLWTHSKYLYKWLKFYLRLPTTPRNNFCSQPINVVLFFRLTVQAYWNGFGDLVLDTVPFCRLYPHETLCVVQGHRFLFTNEFLLAHKKASQ